VSLIEPARVGVITVDVDLEQFAAALSGHGLGDREQRGAESSSAQLRRDVELVE